MKHVVMRYMSTRIKDLPYGCPGFGDIVHSALLTYNYGQHFNEEATLHIASFAIPSIYFLKNYACKNVFFSKNFHSTLAMSQIQQALD